ARAGRADQGEHLARRDAEVDPGQGHHVTGLGPVDVDHPTAGHGESRHGGYPFPLRFTVRRRTTATAMAATTSRTAAKAQGRTTSSATGQRGGGSAARRSVRTGRWSPVSHHATSAAPRPAAAE